MLRNRAKGIAIAILTVALSACSGGSDDGGIIGTGIMLDGTTSSTRTYASNEIEVKAKSGERSTAIIATGGRFSAEDVMGTGPYMMRADLGNGDYLYGIGYEDDAKRVTRNIHSYTDAALRNWFATEGLSIDDTFAGTQPIENLPSEAEMDAILSRIFAIVAAVLSDYNLADTNLATTNYDANDTGVDLYLDRNPVLINNGNITIVVTQQGTLTSTQASTNVPLTTDLTAVDNEPPSIPGSVRALASASNEIVVVWEPSTDNIGVTEYEIFRDAVSIATTPYPVYTDTNLMSDIDYSYHVVAIDASGNASPSSIPATSQTLAAVDSTAPPAPQSVTLTPATGSMGISWNQTEIGDVAAFNISRSEGTGVATELANVSANFLTDFSVMSGTEYCYQVTAVDASGNESPPTTVACANTLGTTVGTITTPVSTDALTAPMVDVSGLACTELLDATFTENTTVLAGCYLANRFISVSTPANLTLQPGVVIKFGSGFGLTIGAGASLTAEGTETNPIVFTGLETTPGYWKGLTFNNSNSLNNRLDHVQLEYAGGGSNNAAAITVNASSSNPSRVAISNTSILNSSSLGFNFDNDALIDKFDRNRVTGNARMGRVEPTSATAIAATGNYTGNTLEGLVLTSASIDKATTFDDIGVPYQAVDFVSVNARLDIKPGAEIVFGAGRGMTVNSAGTIYAVGTATDPILLTSVEPTPGFWRGLNISFSNTGNVLDHVIIENGGSQTTDTGNLIVRANSSNPSRLSASNLTLRNSQTNGFSIDSSTNLTRFENITSTLNQRAGSVDVPMVGMLGTGSNFTGNVEDVIRVSIGSTGTDTTWLNHGVPYSITRFTINSRLDIDPGVMMIMDAGGSINVNSSGAISANGTAAQPIVMTGLESTPGYWDGLNISFSPTVSNNLEHVVIEYGGGGTTNPANAGNITLDCNTSNPSRLQLSDTALNFGLGWGLFIDNSGCTVTIGTNVTYTGNGVGEVNMP